jgi:hypothetical protein
MGTNYYARIIPTKKRRKEICSLINTSENFDKIKSEVTKTYGSVFYNYETSTMDGGEIHLGKRSVGWKFLWNPNWYKIRQGHSEKINLEDGHSKYEWVEDGYKVAKFYDLNKKSIKKFIDRKDIEIYDEYGEKQDKDEFFKMALEWVTWKDADGNEQEAWDSDSYSNWELKENPNVNRNFLYGKGTEYTKFLEDEGFKLSETKHDFYSDGLRFATFTEYS